MGKEESLKGLEPPTFQNKIRQAQVTGDQETPRPAKRKKKKKKAQPFHQKAPKTTNHPQEHTMDISDGSP